MGACLSTVKQWQHETANDPELAHQPIKAQSPRLPVDAPTSYVAPPSPVAVTALAGGGAPGLEPGQSWFFRKSQEQSMAHLIRHPRLQPFTQLAGALLGSAAVWGRRRR